MTIPLRRALAAALLLLVPLAARAADLTRIPAPMVSGLAPSATTDTTNAGNITSGTVGSARLPLATSAAPGAVLTGTAPAGQFQTGVNASGAPVFGQPAFANLAGSLTTGQVPAVAQNIFTGDGSTTAFTLSSAPYASTKVTAIVGGVYQAPASYTLSGTTITFGAAPPSGAAVVVSVGP